MPIRAEDGGCRIRLLIQPRAARDEVVGVHGDGLKLRLTAPPVEGKANQALVRFLAKQLHVTPAAVQLTAGAGSRRKTVRVTGVTPAQARERLGL